MSVRVGTVFGIAVIQEYGLRRIDGDTFEEVLFNRDDIMAIESAVLELNMELNKRCWKLNKIEVGV